MRAKRGTSLLLLVAALAVFPARCEDSNGPSDAGEDGEEVLEECSPPLILCGDECVDIERDNDNCSACGFVCPILTACRGGTCVRTCEPPCTYPRACCDGECFNITSDRWHCGGCGACGMMETCVDGVCTSTQEH